MKLRAATPSTQSKEASCCSAVGTTGQRTGVQAVLFGRRPGLLAADRTAVATTDGGRSRHQRWLWSRAGDRRRILTSMLGEYTYRERCVPFVRSKKTKRSRACLRQPPRRLPHTCLQITVKCFGVWADRDVGRAHAMLRQSACERRGWGRTPVCEL
ncbi:uncharacterized protein PV09_08933 [Verruconis gallopava]|uniref:Uncharacterized protein n=1 Tax=Verruconis gallopava TaxID=253628 RepID=A0A0D2AK88_9PEZI|nr:uncharacterized protein PV09_08933 [Verruconis gallopava]KIV99388.1 hypothetical protein PV09_08933 [Verruconis gallopava]